MKKFCLILALLFALLLVSCDNSEKESIKQCEKGEQFMQDGEYSDAADAFEQAIELDPENQKAYIGAADAYIAQEKYKNALRILNKGSDAVDSEDIEKKIQEVENLIEFGPVETISAEVYLEIEDPDGNIMAQGSITVENQGQQPTILMAVEAFLNQQEIPYILDSDQANITAIDGYGLSDSGPLYYWTFLQNDRELDIDEDMNSLAVYDGDNITAYCSEAFNKSNSYAFVQDAFNYTKEVIDMFDLGYGGFTPHNICPPEIVCDSYVAQAINEQMQEAANNYREILENDQEANEMYYYDYQYKVHNGIVAILVKNAVFWQYSEGYTTYQAYYYDTVNDKRLDMQEYLDALGITHEQLTNQMTDSQEYQNHMVSCYDSSVHYIDNVIYDSEGVTLTLYCPSDFVDQHLFTLYF